MFLKDASSSLATVAKGVSLAVPRESNREIEDRVDSAGERHAKWRVDQTFAPLVFPVFLVNSMPSWLPSGFPSWFPRGFGVVLLKDDWKREAKHHPAEGIDWGNFISAGAGQDPNDRGEGV